MPVKVDGMKWGVALVGMLDHLERMKTYTSMVDAVDTKGENEIW